MKLHQYPRVQDDFVAEEEESDNEDAKVKEPEDTFLGGSGFQMPDNFDLPDEIIQEQLPAARFTSTPIRYAGASSAVTQAKVRIELLLSLNFCRFF